MNRFHVIRDSFLTALIAFIVIGFGVSTVRGNFFEACGSLIQGENCVLFTPSGFSGLYLHLENYDDYPVGQDVCISGNLEIGPDSLCPDAAGYVHDNTINIRTSMVVPFEACGILVQGNGCILFSPGGDSLMFLELENYGLFTIGDTVCVSGLLDITCVPNCPEAIGCVADNEIESGTIPYLPMIPDQVILSSVPGFPIEDIISAVEGIPIDTLIDINTFLVTFPDTLYVSYVIQILENHPLLISIQPNYLLGLPEIHQISQSFPDQGQPSFLDGEEPLDYYGQPGVDLIKCDSAHLLVDGSDVVVAVIDNGLATMHPLFDSNISAAKYDFVMHDTDPSEEAGGQYGHGTFVAGLVRLTAPGSTLMPLRAFDGDGYGNTFTVLDAIYWAIDNGADIINMSFGFDSNNQVIEDAVSDAVAAGVILVASTGNNGLSQLKYPAADSNVIAVTSLDTLDYLADFANYGAGLDVCAPGVNVYSALAGEYNWGSWSGTSFSAPLVSGVCALVKNKIDLTPSEMIQHMHNAANTELSWGSVVPPDYEYGYGALDAFEAVISWSKGDVNNSGELDITDITRIISFIYMGGEPPVAGMTLADCDCDGDADISDLTAIIKFLYLEGETFLPCYKQ